MSRTHSESQTSRGASFAAADYALDFVSWGVHYRLVAENDALLDLMRQHVPFGSVQCTSLPPDARKFSLRNARPESGFQVMADGELLADEETLSPALAQLNNHLMIHVAECAPQYVFIHAGVVAWQGRALLLPGVSHAGKSTLVAELVRGGATYYSDEFALIDCAGRVHPFARDLRMRLPGRPEQAPVSMAQLNGRAGIKSLPVSLVVFAEFAEHARWAPEPVSAGRAVLELLLHSTPVQRTPARVLGTLSAMMRHATAWRSQRGEAAIVARSLLAALATGEAPA
jgi:hypothetical protein